MAGTVRGHIVWLNITKFPRETPKCFYLVHWHLYTFLAILGGGVDRNGFEKLHSCHYSTNSKSTFTVRPKADYSQMKAAWSTDYKKYLTL